MRFSDPTGHDPWDTLRDALGAAADFAQGVGAQVGYNNTSMAISAAVNVYTPQADESTAMAVGRHVGNLVSVGQAVLEISTGAGAMSGGAAACGTGVGCLAGAPAIASGAALAGHGATVGINAAVQEGQMLANLMMAVANGGGKSYQSLSDAQREIGNWSVEDNMARTDARHWDAVRRERTGEQLSRTPGGHIREVQSARRGLSNALSRLQKALRSGTWDNEAVEYLNNQQWRIEERLDLIDQALYGPLD